jgi:23S rRNA (pseudouridine1915-N3)-methyltransferase
MKIKIISVGKIKEKYLLEGIKEYSKRLSKYVNLELVEVEDEKAPENLSEKDKEIIKDKEADRILSYINNEYLIILAIEGKMVDSEGFANLFNDIYNYENSDICFVIGGSLGLGQKLYERSKYKLSFSKMTFPHQLMKLILLEQIYRAFRINKNEPYHK